MTNLCPGMEDSRWATWKTRESINARYDKDTVDGGSILRISSNGKYSCYGKWLCCISGLISNCYRFSVEYKVQNVENEIVSVVAILTWINSKGIMLARDYVDEACFGEDGWTTLSRVIDAHQDVDSVEVELALRWSTQGSVCWRNPVFCKVVPPAHRLVKVAVCFFDAKETLDENLESIQRVVCKAGQNNPDIICLSETSYSNGTGLPMEACVEPIPGKLTDIIAGLAERYHSNIVFNMVESDGDSIYNTSLLFDRDGVIAGKYRKTHLPLIEAEWGVTPGDEYPVFNTDFGVIGMITCWDHFFPEPARILARNGAEIIFVPSLGYAPVQSRARAIDNGVYVVIAGWNYPPSDKCCVIAPDGQLLGEIENLEEEHFTVEIDLDKRYLKEWYSVGPGLGEMHSLYRKERRPDTYSRLTDSSPE